MTLTVDDIDRWDPDAVRTVSRAARRRAVSASAASARLAALPAVGTWTGMAAQAADGAAGRIRMDLDAYADEARAVARAIERAAGDICRIKADLRRLRDGPHFGPVGARLDGILTEATALDAELAQAVTGWHVGLRGPCAPAPSAPAPSAPTPGVPADSSPQAVKRWWESLSDGDRARFLTADPERFGNLDGIPAEDRDAANRRALATDLQAGADSTRYGNAVHIAEAIDRNAIRTGTEILLLTYQPTRFGGQGRAAIAIGDPDRAVQTAVVVPGTGSSVSSGWLTTSDASNLFVETVAASHGEPTSVVAWMGYDAPDSMLDPRVAVPGLAHRGAALLAADVNALNLSGRAGSHVTVVGHSYGSTTVADAAAGYGMKARDVVLIGSPGTDMARTANDFNLPPGGHVYVGSASTDPVTTLSGLPGPLPDGRPMLGVGLGADPTADGFGSTRFKAEVPGFTWQTWTEHSRYFDPGSESLYSIADVAAGDGAALQDHRMTAPHRTGLLGRLGTAVGMPSWSSPLADPELGRPATSGHFHG